MNHKQFFSTLTVLLLLSACTLNSAAPNSESPSITDVDGSFTVDSEIVKLNYAYARKIRSVAGDGDHDILVLVTDKPIPVGLNEKNIESPGFIIQEHNLRCLQLEFTRNNLYLGRDPSRKDWGFHYGKAHHAGGGIGFTKGHIEADENIKLTEEGKAVTGRAKAASLNNGQLSFSVSFKASLN